MPVLHKNVLFNGIVIDGSDLSALTLRVIECKKNMS